MSAFIHQGKKIAETVETPVQGIVTQAEFDALPAEQQNKGLYVIDDGQSSGSGGAIQEIYSTEETRVGTWIDGKPLYRKVYSALTPVTNGQQSIGISVADLNIDSVARLNSLIQRSAKSINTKTNFNVFISSTSLLYTAISSQDNLGQPAFIILEYTKTTDQGGATS